MPHVPLLPYIRMSSVPALYPVLLLFFYKNGFGIKYRTKVDIPLNKKKIDQTSSLWAILNKSWRQNPTKQQLYGHLPPITKTIHVRRTRHAGHCWRSRDELISDVLLWTPSHGRAKSGQPACTYIQQLCEDTGCSPGDLPEAMNVREGWRERVRDILADDPIRWWWNLLFFSVLLKGLKKLWIWYREVRSPPKSGIWLEFIQNTCLHKKQCYNLRWGYVDIGAFHCSQVAKSIFWMVIGCWSSEWVY